MLAQVDEGVAGDVVEQQVVGRLGDEDLAAVPGRADARRAVDADADIAVGAVVVASDGVDAHPDADLGAVWPAVVGQRMLGVGGCRDGVARPLEGHEEGVALRCPRRGRGGRRSPSG